MRPPDQAEGLRKAMSKYCKASHCPYKATIDGYCPWHATELIQKRRADLFPELLEALDRLLDCSTTGVYTLRGMVKADRPYVKERVEAALAVIAKAKGMT